MLQFLMSIILFIVFIQFNIFSFQSEKSGLVIRSFLIDIPGYPMAYNPSFLKCDYGYSVVFRHDPLYSKYTETSNSFLCHVKLDKFFNCISRPVLLDTGNTNSEDPRLFVVKDNAYISYTRVIKWPPHSNCDICCSEFDLLKQKVKKSVSIKYSEGDVEKNWVPFVVLNENCDDDIYFVYKYLPHRILKLSANLDGTAVVAYDNKNGSNTLKKWEDKWGKIRGGTPAILINDEYVAFFHSSFSTSNAMYYVMGVITFESKPPFRIKKISKKPIYFNDMYSKRVTENAWFYGKRGEKPMYVIFPSGLVIGEEDGKDVFYVLCGENDVGIRCVVIDKEILFTTLERAI